MKLKTLVGSLVMLGVVSTSVYAAPKAQTSTNAQINSLTQRIQKLEATINRNQDNAANNPAALSSPNWFQNVVISGEFEPTLAWSNRSFQDSKLNNTGRSDPTGNSSAFIRNTETTQGYLNAAELYIDAQVNSFTDLHAALDYDYNPDKYGTYSSTTSSFSPNSQEMFFSEASVRFSNLAKSGMYSVLGKQYFNFGSYQHDSLTTPFTEMLTKTNGVGATVGYVSSTGFNIDAFALNGDMNSRSSAAQPTGGSTAYVNSAKFQTWGASTGYAMQNQRFGMNFQVDFLNNMAQTIYVSHAIVQGAASNGSASPSNTFYKSVPAAAVHLGLTSGPFGLMYDYVSALDQFNPNDLQTQYNANGAAEGAKPTASNTQLNYAYSLMGHANTAYVGYQTTHNAEMIYSQDMGGYYMPKQRWSVGNKYTVAQNVLVNLEYDHDTDYKSNSNVNDGSGRSSNALFAGLDVKF